MLVTEWTQRIQTKNSEGLVKAVMERQKGTSLLTVCNHLSYIDDVAFYRETTIMQCPVNDSHTVYMCVSVSDLLPLRSLFSERKVKW